VSEQSPSTRGRRRRGAERVPWPEICSLRLSDKARVRAVLADGAEWPSGSSPTSAW